MDQIVAALNRLRRRLSATVSAGGFAEDARNPPRKLSDLIGSAKGIYGTIEDIQRDRDAFRSEWD